MRFAAIATINIALICLVGCSNGKEGICLPEDEGMIIGGSIVFDGNYFWCTRVPSETRSDRKKEIIKFNQSGEVICTFTPKENFRELAFDGENLWTADASGPGPARFFGYGGNFYTIESETGILNKQFTISETYGSLRGLAASEDRLWAFIEMDYENLIIVEITLESKSIVKRIRLPKRVRCSGMAYIDGYLWLVSGLIKKEVLKLDPQSGEVVKRYDYAGRVINGIATDGENIFLVDGERNILLTLNK